MRNMTEYVKVSFDWYKAPYINPGDWVERSTHRRGNKRSTLKYGDRAEVIKVSRGDYLGSFDINGDGRYEYVYNQKIQLKNNDGQIATYNSDNFIVVRKKNEMSTLQLESNRPAFVREFTEVLDENNNPKRVYIGDQKEFTSLSGARIYTEQEITKSIREDNKYRQFAIFTENSIARAKKPEIEFA